MTLERLLVVNADDLGLTPIARARAAGLELTHLDSHHHVHTFPRIRAAVLAVAAEARIPFVRRPRERVPGVAGWRRAITRVLVGRMARGRRRFGPRQTD